MFTLPVFGADGIGDVDVGTSTAVFVAVVVEPPAADVVLSAALAVVVATAGKLIAAFVAWSLAEVTFPLLAKPAV